MWNYYINAMLDINADCTHHAALKRASLGQAFAYGNTSGFMSEDHYLKYVELMFAKDPKDMKIAEVSS